MIWFGVAATSALGAVGRYSVMAGFEQKFDRTIPWGTGVVNLVAAFLLGALMGSDPSQDSVRLLGAGFLGSFSTYSTWMVEGVFIAGGGSRTQLIRAAAWVLGLLFLGIVAYGGGWAVTR